MEVDDDYSMSEEHAELLAEFERRRRARQIHVSTDDAEVKVNLRQLGEPICLFGEGPAERRERLRNLISRLSDDEIAQKLKKKEEEQKKEEEKKEEITWYHEGPPALKLAREWIALYSLLRARDRIRQQKVEAAQSEYHKTAKAQDVTRQISAMHIYCSQVGDVRPLSYCNISPDDKMVVISSWSGLCKLWSLPDCQEIRTFRGHDSYVSAVVFHPFATFNMDPCCVNLASSAFDGSVKLWSLENEEHIASIEGHSPYRVSRVTFHPSGRFLATCCHDESWRLWDLEQQAEVLHQEGHAGPVMDLDFQCDGSVCVTGGMDGYGRVWDLRTGRCIMFLNGHLKPILTTSFSPNGYHIATGGQDNLAKVWDLRQVKEICSIAAHTNLLSHVKFQKRFESPLLLTSSYDQTIKAWSSSTWNVVKVLTGHEQKIMCIDSSCDCKTIVSCCYDKSFKVWTPENFLS